MIYLNLHLVSGTVIKVSCEDEFYETIYENWEKQSGILEFEEGVVHAKDVVFIEYLDE
jgi:hypothetical protein